MSLPRARLIVPHFSRAGERIQLPADQASHARARRLALGDAVILLDGTGRQARARLTRLDRTAGEIEVELVLPAADAGPELCLAVAGIRLERLSWVAEKATELGASRLTIVRTERTQRFRAAPGLLPRLSRLAQEAAKQSESARWPSLEGPLALTDVLARERGPHRFVFDSGGPPFPAELPAGEAALLVGPEGGWTDEERESARARGWEIVALPAGKLRTETAAVAALVLARAALARQADRESEKGN